MFFRKLFQSIRQLKVDGVLCVTFDRGLASKLTSGAGVLKNLKIVISSPQSMLESPNYHHFLPMIVSFILCHLFLSMTIMTVMTVVRFIILPLPIQVMGETVYIKQPARGKGSQTLSHIESLSR